MRTNTFSGSMAGTIPKKYGLIVPKKKKAVAISSIKKPSVFDDSSSDEETGNARGKAANRSLWRENKKNAMQMESHQSVLKALEDDPSVFEYDSLYDDMQEKKKKMDPRLAKKDRNSKYIAKLKRVAERRKVEQDIIYERKVQREMEQEGKEYGDKDTFLTSAYRKKLEERKKMEEELKIAAKKEEAEDVTKQVDLSRFHRTLLHHMTEESGSSSKEESAGGLGESKRAKESLVERAEQSGREETRRRKSSSDGDRLEAGQEPTTQSGQGSQDIEQSPQTDGISLAEREGRVSSPDEEGIPAPPETSTRPAESKTPSLFPPTVDKEKRRKVAATKRANEETLSSAKERYLARKRAKLTAPVISEDD